MAEAVLERPRAAGGDQDRLECFSNEPAWLSRGHVPCLNGLRGIAILLVCLFHARLTTGWSAPRAIGELADRGGLGVDLFFAISGFLITLLMLRELSKRQTISLRSFYWRRTLRILPAYVVYLLALLALTSRGILHMESKEWLALATYTVNFVPDPHWVILHVWSLSLEEQFYLLWPPMLLLIGPRRARWLAALLLLAAPAARVAAWSLHWYPDLFLTDRCVLRRLDSVVAGCLLALLAIEPKFRAAVRMSDRKALGLAALFLLVLWNALPAIDNSLFNLTVGLSMKAVAIAGLLWLCVSSERSAVGRLLEWPPIVVLGTLSYSLYLWQQGFLLPHGVLWFSRWPANIGCALVAAALSYFLIERPFLRLKERRSKPSPDAAAEVCVLPGLPRS